VNDRQTSQKTDDWNRKRTGERRKNELAILDEVLS